MKKTWIAWSLSLLAAVVCNQVMHRYWQVPAILPLEFAHSAAEMQQAIAKTPGADPYHVLLMNTWWDFGFLTAYSFTALFSFVLFFDVFQLRVRSWVYVLAFSTGLLDALENTYLLATAIHHQEKFSLFYFWVVRIKWALAVVPFLMILMTILYGLILLTKRSR